MAETLFLYYSTPSLKIACFRRSLTSLYLLETVNSARNYWRRASACASIYLVERMVVECTSDFELTLEPAAVFVALPSAKSANVFWYSAFTC